MLGYFSGRAELVPEHNLWFGFSSQGNEFCASDLAAASALRPPVLRNVWKLDLAPAPEGWIPMESYPVPLSSGKF